MTEANRFPLLPETACIPSCYYLSFCRPISIYSFFRLSAMPSNYAVHTWGCALIAFPCLHSLHQHTAEIYIYMQRERRFWFWMNFYEEKYGLMTVCPLLGNLGATSTGGSGDDHAIQPPPYPPFFFWLSGARLLCAWVVRHLVNLMYFA